MDGSDVEGGREIRMTFTKKSSKINRPGELRAGHSFSHNLKRYNQLKLFFSWTVNDTEDGY